MTQAELPGIGIDNTDSTDGTDNSDDSGDSDVQFVAVAHRPLLAELGDAVREVLAVADTVIDGDGPGAAERSQIARDVVAQGSDYDNPVSVTAGMCGWGTQLSRAGMDAPIDGIENLGATHLIVDNLATLGRSSASIADRVRRATSAGATVVAAEEGVDVDPETADAVLGVLEALDHCGIELERETRVRDVREWLDDPRRPGRPPLGFDKVDGELVPADDIDEVRSVLSMRRKNEISKRKAADRLGVSIRTINRAMDRIEMYGIRPPAEDPEEMPGRV